MNARKELLGRFAPIAYEYILPDLLDASPATIASLYKAIVGTDEELERGIVDNIASYWDAQKGKNLIQEARGIAERKNSKGLTPDEVIRQYIAVVRQCGQNGLYSDIEALRAGVPFEDVLA